MKKKPKQKPRNPKTSKQKPRNQREKQSKKKKTKSGKQIGIQGKNPKTAKTLEREKREEERLNKMRMVSKSKKKSIKSKQLNNYLTLLSKSTRRGRTKKQLLNSISRVVPKEFQTGKATRRNSIMPIRNSSFEVESDFGEKLLKAISDRILQQHSRNIRHDMNILLISVKTIMNMIQEELNKYSSLTNIELDIEGEDIFIETISNRLIELPKEMAVKKGFEYVKQKYISTNQVGLEVYNELLDHDFSIPIQYLFRFRINGENVIDHMGHYDKEKYDSIFIQNIYYLFEICIKLGIVCHLIEIARIAYRDYMSVKENEGPRPVDIHRMYNVRIVEPKIEELLGAIESILPQIRKLSEL